MVGLLCFALVGWGLKTAFLEKTGRGHFRTSGPIEYCLVLSGESESVCHAPKMGVCTLGTKPKTFRLGDDEENAFRSRLRNLSLAEDVSLAHFNHKDLITVETDASKAGVVAILFQKQNNEWRLICCCSRRWNDHEQN